VVSAVVTSAAAVTVVSAVLSAAVTVIVAVASMVSAIVSMWSTPAASVPNPSVVGPSPGATYPDVAGDRTDGSDLDVRGRHWRLDDDRGIDGGWGGIDSYADSPASAADTDADGELGLG
jgi:hypothetical protein